MLCNKTFFQSDIVGGGLLGASKTFLSVAQNENALLDARFTSRSNYYCQKERGFFRKITGGTVVFRKKRKKVLLLNITSRFVFFFFTRVCYLLRESRKPETNRENISQTVRRRRRRCEDKTERKIYSVVTYTRAPCTVVVGRTCLAMCFRRYVK